MKHLRQILLGSCLVLALSIPAFAGETHTPPGDIGSPGITGDISTPGIVGPQESPGAMGDMLTPGIAGDMLGPGISLLLVAISGRF